MDRKKYPKYLEKGMKFGRLTVIGVEESSKAKDGKKVIPNKWKYICKCSCPIGKEIKVIKYNLVGGHTQSCGCLAVERCVVASKKVNTIEVCGDYTKVFFFNKEHGHTVIDTVDFQIVKPHCWCKSSVGYAITSSPEYRGMVTMQDLIMGNIQNGYLVDHEDNDRLNNRKYNLRLGTKALNNKNLSKSIRNTSGYKGVHVYKASNKFTVRIVSDEVTYHLGRYVVKEHGALAYDIASRILRPEWGKTNQQLGLLDPTAIPEETRKKIEQKVLTKLRLKGVEI